MKTLENKINGRENYYQTLTRASRIADEAFYNFLKEDEFGEYKKIIYKQLLEKKKGKQRLRATLTYLSYCAYTGHNPSGDIENNLAKLMISTELELWSEYMANWIFDNKGGVRENPLTRKKAAVATKSFLEDAIRISGQVGKEYAQKILDTSSNVTKSFTEELIMDLSNINLLEGPFDNYINLYKFEYAIPGIGKTFSLGSDLAALYSGKKNDVKAKKLSDILLEYGIYQEILNDLGDFAIGDMTSDKISSDQFSDIRNGAMTPPIWIMYNKSDKKNKKFILSCVRKENLSIEEKHNLIKNLFENGTYELISKEIKKNGRKFKKQIKELKFRNEASPLLQQSMTVLESNKIYHTLNENYKSIKSK